MKITVNNKTIEYAGLDRVELTRVLADCNTPSAGTAIAVNGQVVKKEDRGSFMLNDNDSIIIIKAVCGG